VPAPYEVGRISLALVMPVFVALDDVRRVFVNVRFRSALVIVTVAVMRLADGS